MSAITAKKGFRMNLQIRAKDLALSDATKTHIENAVEALENTL